MKTLISLIVILSMTSCSISRSVKVKELTESSIITTDNDTIPTKSRLLGVLEAGETYNLYIKKNRCIDASVTSRKRN